MPTEGCAAAKQRHASVFGFMPTRACTPGKCPHKSAERLRSETLPIPLHHTPPPTAMRNRGSQNVAVRTQTAGA
eukprot:7108630-Pyramimonas_sp.AAC.2